MEDEEGAVVLDDDDGEGGGEGGNDEGDGEGMLSVREIVRDNGRPDDSTSKRWLVRYEGEPDDVEVWVPKHQLPLDLFLEFEETRHTRVNRALEPLLSAARSDHPSGVVSYGVDEADAKRVVAFLRDHWADGQLTLTSGKTVYGWARTARRLRSRTPRSSAPTRCSSRTRSFRRAERLSPDSMRSSSS